MMMFHRKKYKDVTLKISLEEQIKRYILFIFGVLLVAIAFNVFILPCDITYGIGGLGVIFKRVFNFDPSLVILIGSVILLILSFILLGYEKTRNSIIGSLLYPLFVKLTENIGEFIDFGEANIVVIVVFGAVISGFGMGLIFKSGFTTGGTDILNQIVAKYFKMSLGSSMFFTDGLIIFSSIFIFGIEKFMYSIITLYIISAMTDKVVIGISRSKAFYIITDHVDEVKSFILGYLSHGVTVLESRGGYTGDKRKVIMCIIPTKEYYIFKEGIMNIDKNAFFLVTDAYEVSGGE